MIDYVFLQTIKYLEGMPKTERKNKGQFFTSAETAKYMASLFSLDSVSSSVSILDPGAVTGVLGMALVDRLQDMEEVDSISLTCYETDAKVLPLLKSNLEYAKFHCKKRFEYTVIEDDYILSQADDFEGTILANNNPPKYDLIIGNPPYLRIMRNDPAATAMPTVVHGAPNLYFLFASMSLFNLNEDAEMVYIIPRSWTSGAYFKSFRQYLLENGKLEHIHLFVSRDKVFSQEQVLQETIIIRVKKTSKKPYTIRLTSSQSNGDFNEVTSITLPYDSVVVGPDQFVFLPINDSEVKVVEIINRYSDTLPDIGIKMKTGVVVDFRQYQDLRKEKSADTCPLFYSQHIRNGRVNHTPSGKDYEWVSLLKPSLVQANKDYVFCKRFTAKEERRRLQCGIYLATDFPDYSYIGTQNKINYVERIDGQKMTKEEVYGLFALLNSTAFDMYYRILDGSTQVNSTEINSIPVPPISTIREIGNRLYESGDLSTEMCDKILNEVAYG